MFKKNYKCVQFECKQRAGISKFTLVEGNGYSPRIVGVLLTTSKVNFRIQARPKFFVKPPLTITEKRK